MTEKELPEICRPFFEAPKPGDRHATILGKNIAYQKRLLSATVQVKNKFLTALENLETGLPLVPNGSFAAMFIVQTAAEMAGAENISLFVRMLSWDWIKKDTQFSAYILDMIKRFGQAQDAPFLEHYIREIEQTRMQEPELERMRTLARDAIAACSERGFRCGQSQSDQLEPAGEAKQCEGYVR